jgi:hypothetical protein
MRQRPIERRRNDQYIQWFHCFGSPVWQVYASSIILSAENIYFNLPIQVSWRQNVLLSPICP